jgi:hypothetical protein
VRLYRITRYSPHVSKSAAARARARLPMHSSVRYTRFSYDNDNTNKHFRTICCVNRRRNTFKAGPHRIFHRWVVHLIRTLKYIIHDDQRALKSFCFILWMLDLTTQLVVSSTIDKTQWTRGLECHYVLFHLVVETILNILFLYIIYFFLFLVPYFDILLNLIYLHVLLNWLRSRLLKLVVFLLSCSSLFVRFKWIRLRLFQVTYIIRASMKFQQIFIAYHVKTYVYEWHWNSNKLFTLSIILTLSNNLI